MNRTNQVSSRKSSAKSSLSTIDINIEPAFEINQKDKRNNRFKIESLCDKKNQTRSKTNRNFIDIQYISKNENEDVNIALSTRLKAIAKNENYKKYFWSGFGLMALCLISGVIIGILSAIGGKLVL
jgi:ribosomal protein L28